MATSLNYLKEKLTNKNVQAAIQTIRTTEGTTADDGYFYLFGSSPRNDLRFKSLATHPNNLQTHNGISSTAAGIGQWLFKTYTALCKKYGITDFTNESQMLLFAATFDDCGCLNDIAEGNMFRVDVIGKLNNIWASLPDSPFGQPTHSMVSVKEYYTEAGGVIA
jgi:muramidase (phage lysozyme)